MEKLCREAIKVIKETGNFIRKKRGEVQHASIEVKSKNSLVSYVDKTAEQQLVIGLGKLLPEATFLTEEDTVDNQESALQWIIDPLDGTTNFLHQLPCFSVSVALQEKGETVLGVIYEINQDECFYAWKGGGAYMNEQKISVSTTTSMEHALLATGFPYYDYDRINAYLDLLGELMKSTRGIRRFGSAAVDLAYVACGRFDSFFEYSLHPWDVAAGAFIVQEAGGIVSDFSGTDNYLHGKEIIATNAGLNEELVQLIRSSFYPF